MKNIFALLALGSVLCAQSTQKTQVQQLFYDGSGNLKYVCVAPANTTATSVRFSDSSLTSVVVSSNVGTVTTLAAHNLWPGAKITLTGSSTSGLNTVYSIATVPSSTTYTITTSGVSDGTYTTGIVITTNSPLLSSSVWQIMVMHYNGSNVLDGAYPASPSGTYTLACTNRANY